MIFVGEDQVAAGLQAMLDVGVEQGQNVLNASYDGLAHALLYLWITFVLFINIKQSQAE